VVLVFPVVLALYKVNNNGFTAWVMVQSLRRGECSVPEMQRRPAQKWYLDAC
jgi:hypothetical protein